MRKIYSFRPLALMKGCRCMTRERRRQTERYGCGRFIHLGIAPHEEVQVDDQRQTDREIRMQKIYLGHWPS